MVLLLGNINPILAQGSDLSSLKDRQAKAKRKAASEAERQQAINARETEIVSAIEAAAVNLEKQGIEFRQLSDSEVNTKYPNYTKIVGRGANWRVVHIIYTLTGDLELVLQPVGGKMFTIMWEFYKDGSFKIGEDLCVGGIHVFFRGKNFLDPQSVVSNQSKIQNGLLKYMNATVE